MGRNVKISHYTVGAGPIETGLLYVLLSGLVCLLGPVLLTLYGDDFYDNSELRFITPLVAYAKESVLIVHDDNDDLWIYSTRDNDANTNLACSVKSSQLEQRVRHSFDCSVENVVALSSTLISIIKWPVSPTQPSSTKSPRPRSGRQCAPKSTCAPLLSNQPINYCRFLPIQHRPRPVTCRVKWAPAGLVARLGQIIRGAKCALI